MGTLTRPITHDGHRLDAHGVTPVERITTPSAARKVWAATRISLGFVFLWAFLDKAFALGFSTGRAEDGSIDYLAEGAAWFSGGSPTEGFLTYGTSGPWRASSRASPGTPSPTPSSWSACWASASP